MLQTAVKDAWLVGRSRSLVRWTLLAGLIYNPQRLSPEIVEEVYRVARKQGAGKAFSSGMACAAISSTGSMRSPHLPSSFVAQQMRRFRYPTYSAPMN